MKKRIISAVAILALLFGPMSLQTAKSQILILDEDELKELEGEVGEEEEEEEEEKEERKTVDFDIDLDVDLDVDEQDLELPIGLPTKGGITIDRYAPLGGEIFVLGCLGGAYLLGRRRKKEKK